MGTPLRVLIVENSEDDASLLVRELRGGGYDPIFARVDTAAAMQEMLRTQEWDCVISDISMPSFSATAALELLKTSGIDLPFIVVLGRTVGEHSVVATMRSGVHDLLIKQDLTRLIPVVERELREATVRRERERIPKSLLASEQRYRTLAEMASDGFFIQRDGKFVFVNSAGLGILGAASAEQVIGKPVYDFIHREFREIFKEHIRRLEEEGKQVPLVEGKILRLDGSAVEVEMTAVPFVFQGNPAAHVVIRDIAGRTWTERRLVHEHAVPGVLAQPPSLSQANSEEKLNSILGSIDNVIWSISTSTYETLYVNPAVEKLYGLPASEFYKNKDLWLAMVHPDDRKIVAGMLPQLIKEEVLTLEYRIIRSDGEERWLEDRARVVLGTDGRAVRFDGVKSDITERKKREHQIEYLATHDDLTGLPSRNLLTDRLAQEITRARRTGRSFALLFIDLDHFKLVNDSYGHPLGDSLLKTVAEEIRKLVREGDTVVRLGGDEFVILLSSLRNPEDTVWVTRKILELFSRPLTVENRELGITASIGASLYPSDGQDLDTLLMNADTAMYRVKNLGRNGVQFYTLEMSAQTQERVALQGSLRQALELQQFKLHYQPQVDIRSRRIIGMEALIRWNHPELGMLPPAKFIPLAEETGLFLPIGEWVLRTACAQNKAWQAAGLPAVTVAVNLSARQFRQEDLVKSVTTALADSGLEARYLELELSESLIMNNPEADITVLKKLKTLGVRLSIDNFGTGYSSLNHLKRFPIDRLKIDQSFLHDINTGPDDGAITQAVFTLGHSMNFNVIGEGVETEAQLAFLRVRGCGHGAQGYLFSRPLPAADLITWNMTGSSN